MAGKKGRCKVPVVIFGCIEERSLEILFVKIQTDLCEIRVIETNGHKGVEDGFYDMFVNRKTVPLALNMTEDGGS